jgi:hypothetical protein
MTPSPVSKYLSPLVHLSSNWISLAGVVLVTTATVFWLFLLPITLRGQVEHPYYGILVFLALPVVFFTGLILIPLGMYVRRAQEKSRSLYPSAFPPLNWHNSDFRRLVLFVLCTTAINIVIGSQLTYGAVNYMHTVGFCGETCHSVMQPEFTAYQSSPHARVDCAECHIGAGASWFVKSKLSGTAQVFAVLLKTYPTPIPSPVQNLRPARETCEVCHWPQRFDPDRLRVIPSYAEDEKNSLTQTVLLLKIGGGKQRSGIHGMHVGEGIHIRYAQADEKRQDIPWVEYTDRDGKTTVYTTGKDKTPGNLPVRDMDCVDCHNRPSHRFQLPERALNEALAAGSISPSLPFIRKQALAILKNAYASREEAARQIPAAVGEFYRKGYPDVYAKDKASVDAAGRAVLAIYNRNIFPDMKVTWGTYTDNLGHQDFPGCFRCHDGNHVNAKGDAITNDCSACHNLLAVDEANPKIATDLGISNQAQ